MSKQNEKQKGRGKKPSVKGRILKKVLSLVLILLIFTGVVTSYLNYSSTNSTLEQVMLETAEIAAERVEWEIQAYKNIAIDLGTIARMSNDNYSIEDRQEIIDQKIDYYELNRGKIIGTDGIAPIDGIDYSDREYFKASMNGEVYVTEPIISKTTGELSIIFSAPLWKGGISGTEVVGVVFIIPNEDFLNDIVNSIQISTGASSYIIDSNGNTIAHKDMELVETSSNTINDAKTDSSLEALAELEAKMINGENGFGSYSYGGVNKLLAYNPIDGTNGWSIAINAPTNDFMGDTYMGIIITIIIVIIAVIVTLLMTKNLADGIANPIKALAQRLVTFSQGDLSSEFPRVTTKDEIAEMITVAGEMAGNLTEIINDSKYRLSEMANSNFTLNSTMPEKYVGEFSGLDTSIHQLNENMNDTLNQILHASAQVSAGSGNLAEAAQSLAEGATEQAGAVEELLATMTNLTEGIGRTSDRVEDTYQLSNKYAVEADRSREEVQNMVNIMNTISETSMKIESIIAEIEEIASQTNLLSLNASIEAARAGEAGRGFAVVADQIGKLAEESAKSAVNTRNLIMDSISQIEKGSVAAEKTAETIDGVVKGMNEVSDASKEVAALSKTAAESMVQAEQGVNQISEVVQANSATAEETSATSEELSAQAISLDELVGGFKLKM